MREWIPTLATKIYWRSADYPSRSIGRRWIILLLRIWIWYTTFTILIVLVVCVFVTTFACVHTNNSSECRCCLDSRRGHPISTFQYTCTATQTTGGRTYYIRVLIVANSIVHLFLVIYVLYNTLFLIIYLVYICLLIKHQPHCIGDDGGEQHGDDAVVQPASPSWQIPGDRPQARRRKNQPW